MVTSGTWKSLSMSNLRRQQPLFFSSSAPPPYLQSATGVHSWDWFSARSFFLILSHQEYCDGSVDDQAGLAFLRLLLGFSLSAFALFELGFGPRNIHTCINFSGSWDAYPSNHWDVLESDLHLFQTGSAKSAATQFSTPTASSSRGSGKKALDKIDPDFHSHSHCLLDPAFWAAG